MRIILNSLDLNFHLTKILQIDDTGIQVPDDPNGLPSSSNTRTNSVKSGGSGYNVNPSPATETGTGTLPKTTYQRGPSQPHLPVSKQESSQSANSSGSSQSSCKSGFAFFSL